MRKNRNEDIQEVENTPQTTKGANKDKKHLSRQRDDGVRRVGAALSCHADKGGD